MYRRGVMTKLILQSLKDAVETSMSLELFPNRETASMHHLMYSNLGILELTKAKYLKNFNAARLQKTAEEAYPITNRPRGKKDIESVEFYCQMFINKQDVPPIIIYDGSLLDGVHRIIAAYVVGIEIIDALYIT